MTDRKSIKKPQVFLRRSQQRGAFLFALVFLVLLGLMVAVHYMHPFGSDKIVIDNNKLENARAYLDSVQQAEKQESFEKSVKIFPFNPNFISDEKGYRLGLSTEEIDRLHAFRQKGNWVNSAEEFKQVTRVSDSLLGSISPYFKFPEWVVERQKRRKKAKQNALVHEASQTHRNPSRDFNTATREELMAVKGVGPVFADRILRLRQKFDGFDDMLQVKDVYGIPPETEKNLLATFSIHNRNVKKINLNEASVAQLAENRYFTYELAREIVLYRKLHEGITTFEELGVIENFPSYRIDRLKIYFTLKKS